jgi:Flp pilus assembly protein TadD
MAHAITPYLEYQMTSSLVSEELCGGVHGCTFHGLRDGMALHEAECAFVQLEPTLRAMQEQIGQLEEQIGDRDAQIDALNVRLRGREVRLTVRDLELGRLQASQRAIGETLFLRGAALVREQKWGEAVVAFRAAVTADPDHVNSWRGLGDAEFEKNGHEFCDAMLEPWTRVIAHEPTNPVAHFNLGGVMLDEGRDVDGAERMFRKAIAIDSEYGNAHWNLSLLLEEERDDLDGAIVAMEECMRCGGPTGQDGTGYDGEARLAGLVARRAEEGEQP